MSFILQIEKLSTSKVRPILVEIQVIILKIGEINTKTESFYAEFFLEASWTEKKSIDENGSYKPTIDPKLIFLNSIGELKQEISFSFKSMIATETTQSHDIIQVVERRKVYGHFWQKFDFKSFPIDMQTLSVEVSSMNTLEQIVLVENKQKLNCLNPKAFINAQEWKLENYILAKESVMTNEISMERYPVFTISMNASRYSTYYIYNGFFLVFLITVISLARFSVPCNQPKLRLMIDTSVTLTLATFKSAMTSDLPQISYLTSLDKYVLFSIMFICVQCAYDSIIGALAQPYCVKPHSTYDLYVFIFSLIVIFVANLVFVLWASHFVLKRKRRFCESSKFSSTSNAERLFNMYNQNFETCTNSETVERVNQNTKL